MWAFYKAPAIWKPNPRPTPVRVLDPIEGANKSRMLKIEAATRASNAISEPDRALDGKIAATTATTRPSIKYLTRRVTISLKSKEVSILYYKKRKTI